VVPNTPENAPKIKYKTPISLWLVENNHLVAKLYKPVGIANIVIDYMLKK
jgi:hypothetical protein